MPQNKSFPNINRDIKSLLQILLEFGQLERGFKGEKWTRVPETRDVRLNINAVYETTIFDSLIASVPLKNTRKRA
jgi:hypothetical protein